MVRRPAPPPRTWLADGDFPSGALSPAAPVEAIRAQQLAAALRAALAAQPRAVIEVAADAGVARSTVYAVLAGDVYADLVTVARLESALGAHLWSHP